VNQHPRTLTEKTILLSYIIYTHVGPDEETHSGKMMKRITNPAVMVFVVRAMPLLGEKKKMIKKTERMSHMNKKLPRRI